MPGKAEIAVILGTAIGCNFRIVTVSTYVHRSQILKLISKAQFPASTFGNSKFDTTNSDMQNVASMKASAKTWISSVM